SAALAIRHGGLRLSGAAAKGERTFPLAAVVQGHWEDPDLVHLAMRNGEILVVRVKDAAEGERLLRAVGVTASERVLRVSLASAASQLPGGSAFGGGLLAICGAGLFFASATLAIGIRDMVQQLDAASIGGFSIVVTIAALFSLAVYALASGLR